MAEVLPRGVFSAAACEQCFYNCFHVVFVGGEKWRRGGDSVAHSNEILAKFFRYNGALLRHHRVLHTQTRHSFIINRQAKLPDHLMDDFS